MQDEPSRVPILSWSTPLVRVLVAGALVLAAALSLRLHGFSTSEWRKFLGDPEAPEIVFGKSRPIRSDDWMVAFSWSMAQRHHQPPFPVVNRLIGVEGQNMLLVYSAPVAHPVAVFRPSTWGWFVGADLGLSWSWYFNVVGTFLASFLLFMILTRERWPESVALATIVLFSPFLQFWSLKYAEVLIYVAGAAVAVLVLAQARSRPAIAGAGVVAGWLAGCFVLTLYPPYQVPLGLAGVAVVAFVVLRDRLWERLGARWPWRAAAAAIGVAIAVAAVLLLLRDAGYEIDDLSATVYPGQRRAEGGGEALAGLFENWVTPLLFSEPPPNICERSSFLLTFPVTLGLLALCLGQRRAVLVTLPLAILLGLLVAWYAWGLPGWLARSTLLDRVTPVRAKFGIGVVDVFLLAALVPLWHQASRRARWAGVLVVTLALVLLHGASWQLLAGGADLPADVPLGTLPLVAACAGLFLFRPRAGLAALAGTSVVLTFWFNPLVRGGADVVERSELATAMHEAQAFGRPHARWVVYLDIVGADLPRTLGLPSVTGTHMHPPLSTWRILDPERRAERVYNRFAHVWARVTPPNTLATFELGAWDQIALNLSPHDPLLLRFDADHALIRDGGNNLDGFFPNYERVWSSDKGFTIYSRKLPAHQKPRLRPPSP